MKMMKGMKLIMNDGLYKLIISDLKNNIKDEKLFNAIKINIDALLDEIRTKHENQINTYSKTIANMEFKVETILDAIDDICDEYFKVDILKLVIKNL